MVRPRQAKPLPMESALPRQEMPLAIRIRVAALELAIKAAPHCLAGAHISGAALTASAEEIEAWLWKAQAK